MTGKNVCASAILAIALFLGAPAMGQGQATQRACPPNTSCTFKNLKTTAGDFPAWHVCSKSSSATTWSWYRVGTEYKVGFGTACAVATGALALTTTAVRAEMPLYLPNGTVGAPALAFTGDTDTGFWWQQAGGIVLAANGVRQWRTNGGTVLYLASDAYWQTLDVAGFGSAHGATVALEANPRLGVRSTYGWGFGTTGTGTAFASFEAAAAGNAGRLHYDSTNAVLRSSNGTAWRVVEKEWNLSAYAPATAAAATGAVQQTMSSGISNATYIYASAVGPIATVTGGNITLDLYDSSSATVLCTVTASCLVGTISQACAAAVPAAHILQLRMDSSGCTGGGVTTAYNLAAQFNGG